MTRHIGNHLGGLGSPSLLGIVDLFHIHLRMRHATSDAILQTLFATWHTSQEGTHAIISPGTTQGIAQLVAEGCDTWHPCHIDFHGQLIGRQGTLTCTPTLTIDKDVRVYLIDSLTNLVHRLDIVTAHEVEAEAINMVFVDPVLHTLNHKLAHHGLF